MKKLFYFICFVLLLSCCTNNKISGLRQKINKIISAKNAIFGIGIYDFGNQDTLFVNKNKKFVMMSVVKFPQALAILNQVDDGKLDYGQPIHFEIGDLRPNTFSPIRNEKPEDSFEISLVEALSYTISKSDNNVCDKLFQLLGNTKVAENYIQNLDLKSISIKTDYANMKTNTIYANQSSPKDMLELLKLFFTGEILSKKSSEILWQKMVDTTTGPDRIKGLLPKGTIVGHKTGTSSTNENGITAAYNDIGIIKSSNGISFAIVVFISNSKENSKTNAQTIAEISKAAFEYLKK